MNEILKNIWQSNVDVICITTNGSVLNGHAGVKYNPMGGGIAREATIQWKKCHPNDWLLEDLYGESIDKYGHSIRHLGDIRRPHHKVQQLLAFPTLYHVGEKASLTLIEISLYHLLDFSDIYPELKIGLPRPGCNIGGLSWEDEVKPMIDKLAGNEYDDRISIYHYQQLSIPNV